MLRKNPCMPRPGYANYRTQPAAVLSGYKMCESDGWTLHWDPNRPPGEEWKLCFFTLRPLLVSLYIGTMGSSGVEETPQNLLWLFFKYQILDTDCLCVKEDKGSEFTCSTREDAGRMINLEDTEVGQIGLNYSTTSTKYRNCFGVLKEEGRLKGFCIYRVFTKV